MVRVKWRGKSSPLFGNKKGFVNPLGASPSKLGHFNDRRGSALAWWDARKLVTVIQD